MDITFPLTNLYPISNIAKSTTYNLIHLIYEVHKA